MKKLLFVLPLLFLFTSVKAQLFIRAHTFSYGVKNEDNEIGWLVENKPVNLLITIDKGFVTINSEKIQNFHLINTITEESNFISYLCTDNENKKCIVFIKNDIKNKKFGILGIDYNDITYFYYSSIEN